MKIQKSKLDKILNILCIVILISTPIVLSILWPEILEQLSIHHNGGKADLIVLPFISWISYGLISLIEHFPEAWNTGIKVTKENKERVYSTLSHLISTLKFLIVFLFNVPIILTITLNINLSPMIILIIFGNIIYWIYKLYKAK